MAQQQQQDERMHGLIAQVRADGFITEGHFAFRSGMHAMHLLDRDRLLSDTHLSSRMGYALARHFFLNRIEVVASPSVWGAGLAQWVGFFLEPRRPVVYATPSNGDYSFSEAATQALSGKRVLVVDNLILTGRTTQDFVRLISRSEGTPIGIGALADFSGIEFPIPTFGLLNSSLELRRPGACPGCQAGTPVTDVGY
jgi:orotate phosphoribosyltransferase